MCACPGTQEPTVATCNGNDDKEQEKGHPHISSYLRDGAGLIICSTSHDLTPQVKLNSFTRDLLDDFEHLLHLYALQCL
eukprot:CAMPEP_0115151306 /NCGR_PEP_ID=MMETSP0227-20121206/65521_1 /TAXON_ID=89957 /ORGANISM="Polarella glacialis, Strain CCMP 1383" /LENGTH=78 /DNA_ID=CAMNT_0002561767 /DNA_START=62 /DNA_END=298 /DNA_ORIENTATION=-